MYFSGNPTYRPLIGNGVGPLRWASVPFTRGDTMRAMLNRKVEDIEELLNGIRELVGEHSIEPYGDWDDRRSVGFRIRGVAATFSVIVEDLLPERHFNVQIESYPPQDLDYLYHNRAVSLWRFLKVVELICGPRDKWPKMTPR